MRGPERIGRVGATSLAPGPDRISPPERISGYLGPGTSSNGRTGSGSSPGGQEGGEETTVPFVVLAFLLVLVVVAVLFAVFFVVRRWL